MHNHSWKRWSRIAFCAALLGGSVSANLGFSPALAREPVTKEDYYQTEKGQYPVKLDDFLAALDKLTAEVKSLITTIDRTPCIDHKRYEGFLLSLNNAIAAAVHLAGEDVNMGGATNKNGAHYISDKQFDSYLNAVASVKDDAVLARTRLKERACPIGEGSMIPPPKSTAGDDDWPDPSQHAGVIHGSADPYPRRGPGGRPYNWPGGKAYPGNDGPNDQPNPGPSDKPDNWPGGGAYPGPGGGAYPVPGGGVYPGPGGM
jgi:hypothetical protein